jgi:hypothetical protein
MNIMGAVEYIIGHSKFREFIAALGIQTTRYNFISLAPEFKTLAFAAAYA